MTSKASAAPRLGAAATRQLPAGNSGNDIQILARLGRLVRVARVSRGLTQRELATRVKRSQNLIWSLESGKTDPGILLLCDLASTLNVPLAFFTIVVAEPKSTASQDDVEQFSKGRDLLLALADGLDSVSEESNATKGKKTRKP